MLYWAFEETVTPIRTITISDARSLYWKPRSRIRKCKGELDQNEFKDNSPFCSCYWIFNSFAHWYGRHLDTDIRKKFIDQCIQSWAVTEWWAKLGDTAKEREKFTYDNGIKCKVYTIVNGNLATYFLQWFWWHWVMTWFKVTEGYRNDRSDNWILDGEVHWGKIFWWHAVFEYRLPTNTLMIRDNYPDRKWNNLAILNKKGRYNSFYHYKYSYLFIYE